MKTFIVTFSDDSTEIIKRDCIENVHKFMEITDRNYISISEIDIYQKLRQIGLTHDQCSEVCDLFDLIK